MPDFPRSLVEFQSRFPDEAACVAYLVAARWPQGFVCPACGLSARLAAGTKRGSCKPRHGLGNAPAAASRPR